VLKFGTTSLVGLANPGQTWAEFPGLKEAFFPNCMLWAQQCLCMHEIKEKNSLDFYLISTNLDSKLKCIEDSTGTLTLLNSSFSFFFFFFFFFTYCFFNSQMILNSLSLFCSTDDVKLYP
jgi:hypothetical protein